MISLRSFKPDLPIPPPDEPKAAISAVRSPIFAPKDVPSGIESIELGPRGSSPGPVRRRGLEELKGYQA
jgi:hypothetical protein